VLLLAMAFYVQKALLIPGSVTFMFTVFPLQVATAMCTDRSAGGKRSAEARPSGHVMPCDRPGTGAP
jgi:hypothetical protein